MRIELGITGQARTGQDKTKTEGQASTELETKGAEKRVNTNV